MNDSCLESKIVNISEEEFRSISERAPSIQRFNDVTEENYNKKQAWLKVMKIVVENADLTKVKKTLMKPFSRSKGLCSQSML